MCRRSLTHTLGHTHTYTRGKLCKWVAILWAVCTLLHRLLRCQSPPCLSFSSPSISVISFCMRRARHTHRDTKIPWTRDGIQACPPSHTHSHSHRTHTNAKLSFISFNTNLTMEQNKMNRKTKQKSQKKTINILCLDIYERKLQTKLKRILTTTTNWVKAFSRAA